MFDALGDIARFRNPKKSEILRDWTCKELRCRVIQGPLSINGYVAVPKGHATFGKDYDEVDVEVHGGLTFGEKGSTESERFPDDALYWFGFDTAHGFSGTWTEEMVVEETERLAEQLAEVEG